MRRLQAADVDGTATGSVLDANGNPVVYASKLVLDSFTPAPAPAQ
ncbi:MAG: hypothetical protein ABSG17_22470 [Spirochaetia bacterium]